jgi:hypothetical protein
MRILKRMAGEAARISNTITEADARTAAKGVPTSSTANEISRKRNLNSAKCIASRLTGLTDSEVAMVEQFGKRRVPPSAGLGDGGGGGRGDGHKPTFPWSNRPDATACDIGFGNFMHTMRAAIAVDGRLHAESLVCASGLAAGFAAQSSLLLRVRGGEAAARAQLLIVQPYRDGPRYLFGDPLNETLKTAFGYSRGGALAAGLPPDGLPALDDSYRHVARMISQQNSQFSVAREHQPLVHPEKLLTSVWPHCCRALSSIPPVVLERLTSSWRHSWPLLTAYATGQFIAEVRNTLDPRVAIVLAFEASLYGSKLDPALVDEAGLPVSFQEQ